MTDWQKLNEIYKPLHERAVKILKSLRTKGFKAKLSYCNLHDVMLEGRYQREYFPLPEIKIENLAESADLGITLEGKFWLEITLGKEKALKLDYAKLAKNFSVEVYGAENYLTDFYNKDMDVDLTAEKIAKSKEKEIHINFTFAQSQSDEIASLLMSIKNAIEGETQ